MAWRGPHPVTLLVLLAACLALAWGQPAFERFKEQHVNFPRTGSRSEREYCNRPMQERGMTWPLCKVKNTFIHENVNTIVNVCGPGGTPAGGNLRDSNDHLPLTVCQLQGGSPRASCNYNGYRSQQRIRIGCEGGVPVHFETQMWTLPGA